MQLKCKYCDGRYKLKLEQWGSNLYLGSCTNPLHVYSVWLAYKLINGEWKLKQTQIHSSQKPQVMSSYEKQKFDKLQIPFWKMMGLKPRQEDIEYEKYLKSKGMTYGDAVLERSYNSAQHKSALPQFEEHINKYGRYGQPQTKFKKG